MKYGILAIVCLILGACDEERTFPTAREAGKAFCRPVCELAFACGHTDGSEADCEEGCLEGTVCGNAPNLEWNCENAPLGSDAAIQKCIDDAETMKQDMVCSGEFPRSCMHVLTEAW